MRISFDFFSAAALITLVQGLFLAACALGLKKGNRMAHGMLFCLLIVTSFSIVDDIIYQTGLFYYMPLLIHLEISFAYLLAPFYYFYIRALIDPGFYIKPLQLFHFLPFIVIYLYYFRLLILDFDQLRAITATRSTSGIYVEILLSYLLTFIQLLIYIILAKRALAKHKKTIMENYSNIEKYTFSWASFIIIFLSIYLLFALGVTFFAYYYERLGLMEQYLSLGSAFFIYILSYKGLTQQAMFHPDLRDEEKKKYKRSTLSREEGLVYMKKLNHLMSEEKLYTCSDLDLVFLAEKLDISRYYLSQVLNSHYGGSFYEFVNSFRIEEVKKMLILPENHNKTILALAIDAGFNAKSTFNKIFKTNTGLSPSEYRKLKQKKNTGQEG